MMGSRSPELTHRCYFIQPSRPEPAKTWRKTVAFSTEHGIRVWGYFVYIVKRRKTRPLQVCCWIRCRSEMRTLEPGESSDTGRATAKCPKQAGMAHAPLVIATQRLDWRVPGGKGQWGGSEGCFRCLVTWVGPSEPTPQSHSLFATLMPIN